MSKVLELLGTSVIASSDQGGNGLEGTPVGAGMVTIGIETDTLLPETCWLEASGDGLSWRRVQTRGMDAALPENRYIVLDGIPAKFLRAASDAPVTGDRTFKFWRILDI